MKLLNLHLIKNMMHSKYATIILTISGLAQVNAQSQRLDSLRLELSQASGTRLCGIYYQIGYELVDSQFKEALESANRASDCALEQRDTLNFVRAIRLKALAFRRLGEVDSSNTLLAKTIPIVRSKRYFLELHDMLHGLGLGLLYKAKFDEALEYSFQALEVRRLYGTQFEIASTLSNIGLIYYKLADYPRAIEYFALSLKRIESEPRDGSLRTMLLVNIALSYAYLNNAAEAEKYVAASLKSCSTNCAADALQNIFFCKGVIALTRNDTVAAKGEFLRSYNLAMKHGEKRLQLDNIIYLSRICITASNVPEAERYLSLAEKLIGQGVPYTMELMKVYEQFATFYEQKGDYRRVSLFLKRHINLKDSIYDDEVTTRLMRIEAGHIAKEKNAEIAMQSRVLQLNAQIMNRQRLVIVLSISTAFFLACFFVMVFRQARERKLRNVDLEQRVIMRTRELESLVSQWQQRLNEKRGWIDKIISCVRNRTNTISGLSGLASRDPESTARCLTLITHEAVTLLESVQQYALRANLSEGR